MPYVYFGKQFDHVGKSLFEIVGCLKNFGAGRVVIRNRFQRYAEPSFYQIVRAEPEMDDEYKLGRVWARRIFRGKDEGIVDISKAAYKWDFQLVPKHEEHLYFNAMEECKKKQKDLKIFPRVIELPPLLKLYAEKLGKKPVMEFRIQETANSQLAKEGEIPNLTFSEESVESSVYADVER